MWKFAVAGWRQWGAAMVAAGLLGVAGCATLGGGGLTKDSPAEAKSAAVTKRAMERWGLIHKGEYKSSYAYLSPGSRETVPLERYEGRLRAIKHRAVKPDQVACEGESCRIKLWLTFDHRVMSGVEVPVEETWLIVDGQAWLVYRE